ncbi:hypothetical protein OOT00_07915 [Desulfobotulus sp. H1]|uniref:Uncharacterized protein n=1 Tax=Desulfobotulus pelophilus TaxID=2823377 RepID=A0ABT3N8Y2_9BACT|nr:hypothetical protein [Desulfobotulus pelophilus]MCW7753908.1 hypothetical protein [Desulfobotulus pelophilus]
MESSGDDQKKVYAGMCGMLSGFRAERALIRPGHDALKMVEKETDHDPK